MKSIALMIFCSIISLTMKVQTANTNKISGVVNTSDGKVVDGATVSILKSDGKTLI